MILLRTDGRPKRDVACLLRNRKYCNFDDISVVTKITIQKSNYNHSITPIINYKLFQKVSKINQN